jgi:hypothetical protein
MFASANNFFYRVTRSGDLMYGRTRWRDLGRPEAALVGVQYVGWWQGIYRSRPYVVRGARTAPWLYDGTGLRNGDRFGRFGVEVDARADSSPRRIVLLARIRDIFGPGKSAEMTYYSTGRGARVFAAGVLNFGASANRAIVDKLLEKHLRKARARVAESRTRPPPKRGGGTGREAKWPAPEGALGPRPSARPLPGEAIPRRAQARARERRHSVCRRRFPPARRGVRAPARRSTRPGTRASR